MRIRKRSSEPISRRTGGEITAAWRQFLDDIDARGLKRPEFVVVDGAPGLDAALVGMCGDDLQIQRCRIHKRRNLLAQPRVATKGAAEAAIPISRACNRTPSERVRSRHL
jgi:transposase-like protein